MPKELKVGISIRATDEFSAPAKRIGESSSRLARKIAAGQKRLGEARSLDAGLRQLAALDKKMRETRRNMDAAGGHVAALSKKILAANGPTKALADEYAAAAKRSASLSRAHEGQAEELSALRRKLLGATDDTRDFAAAQRRAAEDLEAVEGQMRGVNAAAGDLEARNENWERQRQGLSEIVLGAQGVYPHACGGTSPMRSGRSSPGGLSPRLWGNP